MATSALVRNFPHRSKEGDYISSVPRSHAMTAAVAVSSASGLLSLLDEDDESLRLYALQSLNRIVHEFWFQIASQQAIASVEAFYEDEDFSHRELAALVASKVHT